MGTDCPGLHGTKRYKRPMRLESALNTGREGITAHGQAIAVVGDNISNANTTAYKTQRAQFADILGEKQDDRVSDVVAGAGDGVYVRAIKTNYEVGPIVATGRSLDIAFSGSGFMQVGTPEQFSLTRSGSLQVNQDGILVTSFGAPVLGYTGEDTKVLGQINMRQIQKDPVATTQVSLYGNMNSAATTAAPPAAPMSFKDISAVDAYSAVPSVYDSLGNRHDVVVSFFKTGVNQWTVNAYVDGGDIGGTAGQPTLVGSSSLTFDDTGRLTPESLANSTLNANIPWTNGAGASAIGFNFQSFTQFFGASTVNNVVQNGQGIGEITGYEIAGGGQIFAYLDSGEKAQVGTIATSIVQNEDGLVRNGTSTYALTQESGPISTGLAGTGGRSKFVTSSLEGANVDISGEFVDLIILQRGYAASSRVLSTASDIIKDTIGLIR